jgi:GWxTD domain-containing protein
VSAQVSDQYSDYFEGPEGFLMTKQEKKAWKDVSSDAEAEAFIELFWAKRDSDLSTPVNEFRLDFNQRVEAADEMFAWGSTRGALSDRGRVLILLGGFSRRDNQPPGAVVSGVTLDGAPGGVGTAVSSGGAYQNQGSTEIWEYEAKDLPVRVGQIFVHAVFLESKVDLNDYILDRTNTSLMSVLSKIPEALVKHPDLTEVPRISLVPGSRTATSDEIGWFDIDPGPWPDAASAVAAAGLVPGPRHFLWLHLSLPEEAAAGTSVVGRVRSAAADEELGSFVTPVENVAIGGGAYEISVPIGEGEWLLDVALASDAGPLAVTTVEIVNREVPLTGTIVSPFCWGTDVRQEPDAKFGDPFNIGGWRVVPVIDNTFSTTTSDSLNFMAYVLEPELGPNGEPQFEFSISLYKDGQRVAKTPFAPAPLSRLTEGVWMYGSGLPLERFKQPGEYKLKVELKQSTDDTKGMVEIPFEMVDPESVAD